MEHRELSHGGKLGQVARVNVKGTTEDGDIKATVTQKYKQRVDRIQDQHNHNDERLTGAGDSNALMVTLPLVDVMTLCAMGINALAPDDDEMVKILAWAKENRPHLVGSKFKTRRNGKLLVPETVNG